MATDDTRTGPIASNLTPRRTTGSMPRRVGGHTGTERRKRESRTDHVVTERRRMMVVIERPPSSKAERYHLERMRMRGPDGCSWSSGPRRRRR